MMGTAVWRFGQALMGFQQDTTRGTEASWSQTTSARPGPVYGASEMQETSTTGNPTPARERIPALDVLRGFALFGILLVNIEDFSGPNGFGLRTMWDDAPDREAVWLLKFAAEAKFRAVFAFLFGLGFALQLRRGDGVDRMFVARYVRRLTVLLAIGVAHFLLLWEADVLASYALVGFLLLPFARSPARQALCASGVLAGLAVMALSVIVLACAPRRAAPQRSPRRRLRRRTSTDTGAIARSCLTAPGRRARISAESFPPRRRP